MKHLYSVVDVLPRTPFGKTRPPTARETAKSDALARRFRLLEKRKLAIRRQRHALLNRLNKLDATASRLSIKCKHIVVDYEYDLYLDARNCCACGWLDVDEHERRERMAHGERAQQQSNKMKEYQGKRGHGGFMPKNGVSKRIVHKQERTESRKLTRTQKED